MADPVQEEVGIGVGENISFLDGFISQETRRRTREQTQPIIDACCSPGCIRSTVLTVGVAALLLTTIIIAVLLAGSESTPTQPLIDPYAPPYWMLSQITAEQLRTHMKFLSDDLLEGRAPGTRGEDLTVSYISSHFRAAGLKPLANANGDDPFTVEVPLRGMIATGGKMHIQAELTSLDFYLTDDFTADIDYYSPEYELNAPMVFVGNCLYATKFNTNNFRNEQENFYTGKLIVCLDYSLNVSNLAAAEYYSIMSRKFLEADAKTALGVLMVHTEASTGYSWEVFQNRFGSGEQINVVTPKTRLFKAWIKEDAASQIAQLCGDTLSGWIEKASVRNFTAYQLPTTVSLKANFTVRYFDGHYVVGYVGPAPTDYSVLLTAHHDSLGIRAPHPSSTDNIFNGAVDNASGVAAIIASAYALAALYKDPYIVNPNYEPPPLRKTVIFMASTASEYMIGAQYFVDSAFCYNNSMCGVVTVISYDTMNVWGHTYQAVVVGQNMSTMVSEAVEAAVKSQNMKSIQATSSHGDLWPFIVQGIPSITFAAGSDRDPNPYFAYKDTKQYMPSDEYNAYWSMDGVQQQAKIGLSVAYSIAINKTRPTIDFLDYVNL